VEDVELVQREQVEMLEHELLRHEVAAHVEVTSAPAEARAVLDLDAGDAPGDTAHRGSPEDHGRKQLPQRLAAMQDARGAGRANVDLFRRDR